MKQRNRMIHAGFFENRDLALLGPAHQVLFAGLWTIADREGKLVDIPKRIEGVIFPYTEQPVHDMLYDLEVKGFITRADNVITICKFGTYQKIHPNEAPSKLNGEPLANQENTKESPTDFRTTDSKVGKRKEVGGKRKEVKDIIEAVPFEKIIDDLNQVTGRFKGNETFKVTETNRSSIGQRWKELTGSYEERFEVFKWVHRIKAMEWTGTEQEKHLNPGTLYRKSKFEIYRYQRVSQTNISDTNKNNQQVGMAWLAKHGQANG